MMGQPSAPPLLPARGAGAATGGAPPKPTAPPAPPATVAAPSGEAVAHYSRARMLEENGDDTGALAEFLRVLALDPHSGSAARRGSEVAARLGESGRSLELADRALAIDASDAHAPWLKGSAEFSLGRPKEALVSPD